MLYFLLAKITNHLKASVNKAKKGECESVHNFGGGRKGSKSDSATMVHRTLYAGEELFGWIRSSHHITKKFPCFFLLSFASLVADATVLLSSVASQAGDHTSCQELGDYCSSASWNRSYIMLLILLCSSVYYVLPWFCDFGSSWRLEVGSVQKLAGRTVHRQRDKTLPKNKNLA